MFGGSTAGGFQPGPTTGNIVTTGGSGGGDGLTQSDVQTLIDASISGPVAPSSVTTTVVKASGGLTFDTSNFPDGEESSIEREGNGGMILKRGTTTFLNLSPFTGATFGTNVTTTNLTVNGTFTPSGGIAGYYSSAAVDTLLSGKQPTITAGSLAIGDVANLQTSLNGKQPTVTAGSLAISDVANLQTSLDAKEALLYDHTGTGVTLRYGSELRRAFGANGISVLVPINIANPSDPENFNLKIDGSALQTSIATKADSSSVTALQSTVAGKQPLIADGGLAQSKVASLVSDLAAKQPLLTSSSDLVVDTVKTRLFVGDAFYFFNDAQTSSLLEITTGSLGAVFSMGVRAPALSIGGNVGIGTASPAAKLDVVGTANVSGNLTSAGIVSSTGGGYIDRAVISCVTSSSSAAETVGADFYFGSAGNAGGIYGALEWSLFASPSRVFEL